MSLNAGSIYLSSYNNGDYDTTNNFTVTLSVPIVKAKRLRVLSANFPNILYPFGLDDNTFTVRDGGIGGADYTIVFPTDRRFVTVADFIAFTDALFIAQSAPFRVTYDDNTGRITISNISINNAMYIPRWTYTNANFRLGYTSVSGVEVIPPFGTYASITADGFLNIFNRTNSIYVTSNISVDSNNDSNIGNIISRIPISANFGQLVNYENVHSEFSAPIFTERIKDISIQLLDENYQPLNLPNNAYFTLTLGVEY